MKDLSTFILLCIHCVLLNSCGDRGQNGEQADFADSVVQDIPGEFGWNKIPVPKPLSR